MLSKNLFLTLFLAHKWRKINYFSILKISFHNILLSAELYRIQRNSGIMITFQICFTKWDNSIPLSLFYSVYQRTLSVNARTLDLENLGNVSISGDALPLNEIFFGKLKIWS